MGFHWFLLCFTRFGLLCE